MGEIKTHPHRKPRGSVNGAGYSSADSGCKEATAFLKSQSRCLKCPFPECLLVKSGKSDRHWKKND